jgi:hypothetical protein
VYYSPGGPVPYPIAVADLRGDQRLDLVFGLNGATVGVMLNDRASDYLPTTTTLLSSPNPGAIDKKISYTASVSNKNGGTATGSVTFLEQGSNSGAVVSLTNGQAVYTTEYKTLGVHSFNAFYSGDANNDFSESATVTEHVMGASVMTLTTSGSPSRIGQSVTFTATVTSKYGAIPDGELVTFYDGPAKMGSVALAGEMAAYTTSLLSAGKHTIKAEYSGDAIYKPSTREVSQVVNKNATTTTLSSSMNPSRFEQAVTFTAQVTSSGPPPTGKVTFKDGTRTLGSAKLSGGVATLTTSKLAVGTHPIAAEYLGDADNATSTSPVLDQVVQ